MFFLCVAVRARLLNGIRSVRLTFVLAGFVCGFGFFCRLLYAIAADTFVMVANFATIFEVAAKSRL